MNHSAATLAFLAFNSFAHAQGTFRNLDFESASVRDLAPRGFEVVPTTEGIPSWTQYSSGQEQPGMIHNALSAGGEIGSILGPQYALDGVHITPIIEGRHMVYMRPGPKAVQDLAIAQTGTIPIDSHSILFKTLFGKPSIVSLGGSPLNLIPLESSSKYTLYGADVTGFAGQTEELRFTTLGPFSVLNNEFFLDSIEFSTLVVPEPSAAMLLTGGLAILAGSAWYRKK